MNGIISKNMHSTLEALGDFWLNMLDLHNEIDSIMVLSLLYIEKINVDMRPQHFTTITSNNKKSNRDLSYILLSVMTLS